MSRPKVYVIGTVQPGLNANFRKVGFCGTFNTPTQTKAVLDLLDHESWAIPFDHIFYREGVDEKNPPKDHRMQGRDVIGNFIGGVLTEKGDTVMVAELDPAHEHVESIVSDLRDYRSRVEKQILDGVAFPDLEKPPFGFSPQADIVFDPENGVISKDFKNISIVKDPEYGAEGANFHAMSFKKDEIMKYLADNFLSKDAYASPAFGDTLWSIRGETRPPSTYTPKIMIPIDDDGTPISDPMDVEPADEAPEDTTPPETEPIETDNGAMPPPILEDAAVVNVYSSREKNDTTTTSDMSNPQLSHVNRSSTVENSTPSPSVSPALSKKPSNQMEENGSEVSDVAQNTPGLPQDAEPEPERTSEPDSPPPRRAETREVPPSKSVLSSETQEQQRANAAESADNFYRRAQERQTKMNSLKSESETIKKNAEQLLSEFDVDGMVIEATKVMDILRQYQKVTATIDELNLGRKDIPRSYTVATAKADEVLRRFNQSVESAAKERNMQDEIPKNLDDMMDSPSILQANEQILRVFSKSLRGNPNTSSARVNQRVIDNYADKIRESRSNEYKRPRASQSDDKGESAPADKKTKFGSDMFQLPRSKVIGVFGAPLLRASVYSSRSEGAVLATKRDDREFITNKEKLIRERWVRLARKNLF